jgi:MFS transporter, Spinster family, sphingosine-1-phosphate transporter
VSTGEPGSPWRLLAALTALNVLSYVDRQLLAAVAPLLIEDLGLSRAQIGLLLGFAFILVYAAGTLVVGLLADRRSRPRLIAGGLAAWSAATALTGTATSFAPLAVWRALVGIGEATLPPAALAMIGDRVPAARVGFANGVFYAGIPVGFAVSFALAGVVAPALGWRACFFGLGVAGLFAVWLVWRMADPPRRGGAVPVHSGGVATAAQVGRALLARPSLLLLILAGTLLVYASAASQHAITWLVEERGFTFQRAAFYSAALVLVAGLAGNLGIGALTDRAWRQNPGARLVALAALGALGLAAALVFYRALPDSGLFLPAWLLAQAWLLGWFGPLLAAIDEMAPPGLRASVIGFALLFANGLGVGAGAYVTGLVGDRYGLTAGLSWSLVPAAVGVVLVVLVGLAQKRRA